MSSPLSRSAAAWIVFTAVGLAAVTTGSVAGAQAADKKTKIVLLAGERSHGYGSHEHKAGCMFLADCLNKNMPSVQAVVCDGWPDSESALDDAAAIVAFCDGNSRHVLSKNLKQVDKLMKKGVGLACLHYAVELPKGEPGNYLLDWMGGYYEVFWSVNPHWQAEFTKLPEHPITRGVKPFAIEDEWYYHMRFRENMEGVTPILTAVPPDSTRERPDGSHSGNPVVRARKGMPEHVAWAYQRPDGGRGFGFTGGHWHWNWANDNFRTVVLNGIVWVAGIEPPPGGVPSQTPAFQQLEANQDYPQPPDFNRQKWLDLLKSWQE